MNRTTIEYKGWSMTFNDTKRWSEVKIVHQGCEAHNGYLFDIWGKPCCGHCREPAPESTLNYLNATLTLLWK